MKEELRKLYAEYKGVIDEEEQWTLESIENFWHWVLTGKLR